MSTLSRVRSLPNAKVSVPPVALISSASSTRVSGSCSTDSRRR